MRPTIKKKNKLFALALAVIMIVGMLPTNIISVSAAPPASTKVSYIGADGKTKDANKYGTVAESANAVTWVKSDKDNGGFYVVNSSVTVKSVTVNGAINLILCDGATLTVTEGIYVGATSKASLNIFAQSQGTGALITNGSENAAGIGGNADDDTSNGAIKIYGGNITATGGSGAAGIGGGQGGTGSDITINGGTVTAIGGSTGVAGIGSGSTGSAASKITIGTGLAIKAGADAASATAVANDASLLTNLAGKQYVKILTPSYLTFTAKQANSTVALNWVSVGANGVQYSTNGTTWNNYTEGEAISLAKVDSYVKFKGDNVVTGTDGDNITNSFVMTGKIAASGDYTSIINGIGGDAPLEEKGAQSAFNGCKSLVSAPSLPSTTLNEFCYSNMFKGCSSLEEAPALPAATLARGCYGNMFQGCSSLKKAPELSATNLAATCYAYMFNGCSSLEEAPKLPATTLKGSCYYSMFAGCTSLKAPADTSMASTFANSCFGGMYSFCSQWNITAQQPQSGTYITYTTPDTTYLTDMFSGTGGDFSIVNTTPAQNTTYYFSAKSPVKYIDETGKEAQTSIYTVLTEGTLKRVTWNMDSLDVFLVAEKDTVLGNEATINIFAGNSKIILCDDATLTVTSAKANAASDSSISVYCQKNGTGKLIFNGAPVDGKTTSGYALSLNDNCVFNLYGGSVTFNAGSSSATTGVSAICSNTAEDNCSLNIYGGTLTANGGTGATTNGKAIAVTNLHVADSMVVKAGANEASATKVANNASLLTNLADKQYVKVTAASYVAQINTDKYESVAEAIKAASTTKSTVKMIANSKENITIAKDQDITLDLNGFVLSGDGTAPVITNNGKLTVADSNAQKEHKYDTANAKWLPDGSTEKGEGIVTVKGGVITGGNASKGGGIYNVANSKSAAELTVNGGNIMYNTAVNGGGIYNARYSKNDITKEAKLTITKGTIAYNTAESTTENAYGGGVYNAGILEITGGKLEKNTATASADDKRAIGGGLYIGKTSTVTKLEKLTVEGNEAIAKTNASIVYGGGIATFSTSALEIKECTVKNNKAEVSGLGTKGTALASGGGIYVDGEVTVSGKTAVSNNSTYVKTAKDGENVRNSFGGGITVASNGKLTIADANVSITKNHTESTYKAQGAGVYLASNASFTMTAGSITENTLSAYKDTNVNEEEGAGVIVTYASTTFTVGGTAKITGNKGSDNSANNVYLRDNALITVGTPAKGMAVGVTMNTAGKFTSGTNATAASLTYFTTDNTSYTSYLHKDGYLYLSTSPVCKIGDVKYPTVKSAIEAAKASTKTTVTLTENVKENVVIPADKNIVLDLNGFVLSGDGTTSVIENNGTLTVKDSNGTKVHKFTLPGTDVFTGLWTLNEDSGNMTVKGGIITGGIGKDIGGVTCGGGIYNNGKLTIEGGYIAGNKANHGGGVFVTGSGSVEMTAGKIQGNQAIYPSNIATGGGVYVATNGSFKLNGDNAIISDNKAVNGGGIWTDGAVTLTKGSVFENAAADDTVTRGNGGGVYVYKNGSLTSAGNITNNYAKDGGGGVFTNNKFTMTNGTVSYNTSDSHGAGVYLYGDDTKSSADANKTFTMSGGKITNNTSKTKGAGVYVDRYDITMNMTGGEITNNKVEPASYDASKNFGGGVCACQSITVSGSAKITGNKVGTVTDNLLLRVKNGESVPVINIGTMSNGASIGVTVQTPASVTFPVAITNTSAKVTDLQYFSSDNTDYTTYFHNDGYLYLSTAPVCKIGDLKYPTVAAAIESAKANTNTEIDLIATHTENIVIPANKNITLDLNGYVLSGDGKDSVIINNGTLTVTDSSGAKNGAITGGKAEKGGAVYNIGVFTLEKGTIKNCSATYVGGAIYNLKGSVVIKSTIENCTAGHYGGGIYNASTDSDSFQATAKLTLDNGAVIDSCSVAGGTDMFGGGVFNKGELVMNNGATIKNCSAVKGAGVHNDGNTFVSFTMNGGEIKNNTATANGGGVQNSKNATFKFYGGSITKNNATNSFGGGVFNAGTMELKGNGTVTANTVGNTTKKNGNIAVVKGANISLNNFTGSAGVCVVEKQAGVYTEVIGQFTSNGASSDVSKFTPDNDIYQVKFNTNHLEIAKFTVTEATCTGGTVSVGTTKTYAGGEEVTLTITPSTGWELDSYVIYKTGDAKKTSVATKDSNNKFTMPKYDITIEATFKDVTDPTADIKIGANSIKKAINEATFGLFYKNYQEIEITSSDAETGVKSTKYYLSDTVLTEAQVKAISSWTDYSTKIKISPDTKKVVYVKVTDNADNVIYIGSDGLVVDATAPVIAGITDGETYYVTQKFTVTDATSGVKEVKVNGTAVTDYTLAGDVSATYTVTATDNSGNSSSVTVTMKPIETLDDDIENITVDDVTSADKEAIETVKTDVAGVDTTNATLAEKQALEDITDNCDTLLAKISDIESAIETAMENAEKYPLTEINLEDKEDIEEAIQQAENIPEGNLTEDENEAVTEYLNTLYNALESIERTEAVIEQIENLPEELTVSDEEQVLNAKDAYNALSDYEKSLVGDVNSDILFEAVVTAAEVHRKSYEPKIIEGANLTIDKDKDTAAVFRSEAPIDQFVKVMVDGKEVNAKYYTVTEGSTIITVNKEFINSYEIGKHELSIVSTYGHADTEFTITGEINPKTGDNLSILWLVAVATVSLCGACTLPILKKNKAN